MIDHIELLHRLVKKFANLCEAEERILAAFLGGSLAAGTADEWSDLDLYIVVEAAHYESFFEARRQFLGQWAPAVFLEDFNEFGFDMLIFILENGVQGELGMADDRHFTHIHGGPTRVLVDKRGLLEGIEFPLTGPSTASQVKGLERQLIWFWRDLALLIVAFERNQKWTAYEYLEAMRQRCVKLMRMDADFDAWAEGYEKLERAVAGRHSKALESTISSLDLEEMKRGVAKLIGIFQPLARKLALEHRLPYPEAVERTVLTMGKKKFGI